jgi:nitrite reductase/ring-hydroxylating ferredoxin subunit
MPEEPHDRIDRIVEDLLRGRKLRVGPGDAAERKSIFAAIRLVAAREGYPRMSPALRRRLAEKLGEATPRRWISRRAALAGGLGVALGAVAGAGIARVGEPGAAVGHPSRPLQPSWQQAVVDPKPGRWTDVAVLADLPEGAGVRVQAGSVGAYLFRSGSKVTAVSSICSHLPCELGWVSAKGVLNCPCHNQEFKPDGQSLGISYPLPPLASVQVRVVDGRVQVLGT